VSDIAADCAEHRAAASIGIIHVSIAVPDTQCHRCRVLRPRRREHLAQIGILPWLWAATQQEYRNCYRVPYRVPAVGLSGRRLSAAERF
jgi:hypothetical protein